MSGKLFSAPFCSGTEVERFNGFPPFKAIARWAHLPTDHFKWEEAISSLPFVFTPEKRRGKWRSLMKLNKSSNTDYVQNPNIIPILGFGNIDICHYFLDLVYQRLRSFLYTLLCKTSDFLLTHLCSEAATFNITAGADNNRSLCALFRLCRGIRIGHCSELDGVIQDICTYVLLVPQNVSTVITLL